MPTKLLMHVAALLIVATGGGTGYYRMLGVPPGTYRLRVTKQGYQTDERDVAVTVGSPSADFTLQTQP